MKTIELDLDDLEISIVAIGQPIAEVKGNLYGLPENCFPNEPAYVEDLVVFLVNKNKERLDITDFLSDKILDEINDLILEESEL